MVLEHIFPEELLERKALFAFLLGAIYSVVGIGLSLLLFPQDPALVAVAFTSILILPSLYDLLTIEERIEDQESTFSFYKLFKDNKDITKTYIFLFLGILLTYSFAAMMVDTFQANAFFKQQIDVVRGQFDNASGSATFGSTVKDLFFNNIRVLVFCFLLSLLSGDGALFLIVWNASVWGTVFGAIAKGASLGSGALNPLLFFGIVFIIIFWHMALEALAYILAAISGGVISKDVLRERIGSDKFTEVIYYNLVLFGIAVATLALAAVVESFVLHNATIYAQIYSTGIIPYIS
ncbi:stage II sporulation protein M [Candidatus Woesearchaeota archaeon]|nr:stage II sporulation protein M [Candidatus Woesearchaeota archaeon]